MYNRVLLTLDGSPLAEQAARYATELAVRYKAELHILRVVEPMIRIYYAGAVPPTTVKAAEERLTEMAEEYLEQFVSRLEDAPSTRAAVRVGIPYQAIIDYAEQNMVDLIVMTSHGRSGLTRWLLGSVTDHVVRGASVPVVVVPISVASDVGDD